MMYSIRVESPALSSTNSHRDNAYGVSVRRKNVCLSGLTLSPIIHFSYNSGKSQATTEIFVRHRMKPKALKANNFDCFAQLNPIPISDNIPQLDCGLLLSTHNKSIFRILCVWIERVYACRFRLYHSRTHYKPPTTKHHESCVARSCGIHIRLIPHVVCGNREQIPTD